MSPASPDDRIEIVERDITTLEVDAIVNAANPQLTPGGGVCGAIHDAAGPELAEACAQLQPVREDVRCPTGEARITPGFNLPAMSVIHAVGPIWQGGFSREANRLAAAYRNTLELARQHDIASIAIPALSCGIFGYPVEQACTIALGEIRSFLSGSAMPERVILCDLGRDVLNTYAALLDR